MGSIGFNGNTQVYSSGGVTPGAGVYATILRLWITETAANVFSTNLPAHKAGALPAGGNEVLIDGSGRWTKAKDMRYITYG